MGCCFCRGDYFQRKYHLFYLAFILWIVLSNWLKGNIFPDNSSNFIFVKFCALCGIALPFAHFLIDWERRNILHAFLFPILLVFACFLLLAFVALLQGSNICIIPDWFEFGATYTSTGRIMLKVLNLHYYHTGYLSTVCFFSCLYLAVSRWSSKSAPLWILLLTIFTAGVFITYSRTAVFSFIGGLLLAFHIFLQRIGINTRMRRLLFIGTALVGFLITCTVMNIIYKAVHSIRDIWYGIATLSSRTDIWRAALSALRDHPGILLHGFYPEQISPLVKSYLPDFGDLTHLHSGYLTTLFSVGLPGFVLVITFCLYLCKCAYRLFIAPISETVRVSDKCLVLVPLVCLTMNLVESIAFFCLNEVELLNLLMMLFSGYVFEKVRTLS